MTAVCIERDADFARKQGMLRNAAYVKVWNCHSLTALPDLPSASRVFVAGCPRLTALPDLPAATIVGVWNCPGLTALPDLPSASIVVVGGCPGLGVYRDPRGYSLIHRRSDDRFFAGCRSFTRAEALAHWGSAKYPNKTRGAEFCAAINKTERPE